MLNEFIVLLRLDTLANSTHKGLTKLDFFSDSEEQNNHHVTNSTQPNNNCGLFFERKITQLKNEITFQKRQINKKRNNIYF